jgi:hypothetical protein
MTGIINGDRIPRPQRVFLIHGRLELAQCVYIASLLLGSGCIAGQSLAVRFLGFAGQRMGHAQRKKNKTA